MLNNNNVKHTHIDTVVRVPVKAMAKKTQTLTQLTHF